MRKSTTLAMAAALGCCTVAIGTIPVTASGATSPAEAPVSPFAEDWGKVLETRSAALASIKFVMKIEPGSQEQEAEITAVMIDSKGILLCSNTQTGGFPPLLQSRMGGMTATPINIKVLLGDDTDGLPAKIIARDSELDLAWIQIDDAGDRTFTAVDFTQGQTPAVGETLLTVARLGKFFDRAPILQTTRLGGITRMPRRLYIPADASIANELGTPVFTTTGAPVGFTVLQLPEVEDVEGGGMNAREYMSVVILPAEDVVRATARAMEAAATSPASSDEPGK